MTPATTALLCTTAPLVTCFLALVVLARRPQAAALTTIAGGTLSLLCALLLLAQGPQPEPLVTRWLPSETTTAMFGFLLDGTNLLFGAVVAAIVLLIEVYSWGYMAGDRGRARYFALLGLFSWSMLSFVYAASLLQTFIFWELVGLASFLLIGFWYEKPAAAAAGRKAFVMTRIGDVGLFIGLILLMQATGTLDIARINAPAVVHSLPSAQLTLIALLLFCGVVGKSAQFPLHTWLPDAMEGPTPVSALLHSATMVAAGVFLFARFHPLMTASATVTLVVFAIATFTAVLSATIAMVQQDIKRVLAYSSISQLSYMLLGLAAGSLHAGVFHLTTHAFFKALLFLCAGAYIHHHGTNDMVAIGRKGGRSMRWTTVGLLVGGAALAGVPGLSGFFSKEAILATLGQAPIAGRGLFVIGAYLGAFLTAYYTFRMLFLVVRPNAASTLTPEPPEEGQQAHGHGSDAPWVMRAPILLLTAGAAASGYFGDAMAQLIGAQAVHVPPTEAAPAVAITLLGIGLAWVEFGRTGAQQAGFIAHVPPLRTLFVNKWYVDDFHDKMVGGLTQLVSRACALVETRGLDGFSDGVAEGTVRTGQITAGLQNGRLQIYIGTAIVFLAIFCYFIGAI